MKNLVYKAGIACLFPCFILGISTASFCQKFKYIIAEKNMGNWDHTINAKYNGGVLDVNHNEPKRKYTATTCDADLKNILSKELDFLNDKTYQFTFFSATTLYMFATDKNESLIKYQVNPETFALIGSPENILSVDDDRVEYRSVYSKDSAYFSILCRHYNKKGTDNNFSGIVFNSTFAAVNKFEFSSIVPSNEVAALHFLLSESGTAAIICKGIKHKKKSDDEVYYSATVMSANEKPVSKQVSGFPLESNQNVDWYLFGNDIVFSGVLGESQKKGFTKVVAGHYNINSGAVENMQISALDGSDVKLKSNVSSVKEQGIPFNVSLKYAIHGDDNSTFLIYDQNHHYQVQDHHEPGKFAPVMTEYISAETYVIKLNGEKPEWFHVITKNQSELELQQYTGINYILGKDNTLYIFFYDNNNNQDIYTDKKVSAPNMFNIKKSSLACVTIKPGGDIRKSFLWDNTEKESYMMPNFSILSKRDEVTFVAIKKSKDGWFTFSKMVIDK